MSFIDPILLLKELVSIPSPSGKESAVADAIVAWTRNAGLVAEMIGRNVVITLGQKGGKRILLNSHMDTVPPAADWRGDPYAAREENGKMVGLGSNDAKGSVASMLSAAANLRDTKLDGELIVAITVDEETGRGGEGLEWLIGRLGKIDAAVIGEPTGLDICRAQKGLLILDVESEGLARHAAHAHRIEGKNAVVEAARAILALEGWRPGPEHPLLGKTTCQVTMISGGTRHNVIPDRCSFCLDLRTVPGMETAEIVEAIQKKTHAKVTVRSDRMRSFETPEGAEIIRAAIRARPASKLVGSSTMSDAIWTRHLPTIKVGPGETERSHTAGEYITVDELKSGAEFYERLVREYLL